MHHQKVLQFSGTTCSEKNDNKSDTAEEKLFDAAYIEEKFKIKEYGPVELCILKALHKYLFLDAATLAEAVNQKLDNRLQKPDYSRNLKNMLGKTVKRQKYIDLRHNGYQKVTTVVYYLTYPAYSYMKDRYSGIPVPHRLKSGAKTGILAAYDEYYIKERLMLNRWHLNTYTAYQETICMERYCQKANFAAGRTNVHSLIRIKTKRNGIMQVIALPYGERSSCQTGAYDRFINKVKELNKITLRNASQNTVIVAVCDTYERIDELCKMIKENDEKLEGSILYALEVDSITGDGIERLYRAFDTGKEIKRTYCSIIGLN